MKFDNLIKLKNDLLKVEPDGTYKHFASEELLRFISIGGTVLESFPNVQTCINERMLSHIYLRSILENFFWLLYIFDGNDQNQWAVRYDEYVNSFKKEYVKLYNESQLPYKSELVAPDSSWQGITNTKDTKSMLAAVRNIHGDRLDYLYFTYRVTSFDVHGKTLSSLAEASFSKKINFPVLKPKNIMDIIANEYWSIWQKITQ
jgi:hypothetical protein